MFNLKKTAPTDFELRNDEARSAYSIREAKKEIARKVVIGTAALAAIGVATLVIVKVLDGDIPLED